MTVRRTVGKEGMKLARKLVSVLALIGMAGMAFVGCGGGGTGIHVITREEGSGTRGAFTELLGVVDENEEDAIISSAEVTNSTQVMITTVAGDRNAIGYISLGSLSADVKAVQLDGVSATVENVKNGTYKLARPFNLAYKDTLSAAGEDFIDFIMSEQGQSIITAEGYIGADDAPTYTASGMTGTVKLAGSTSVAPVMYKLQEAYMRLNNGVTVEVNEGGSGAGMTAAINGTCDIGMASRDLTDSEKAELDFTTIATDGIAVIVNVENSVSNLTSEEVRKIYLGQLTNWSGR